MAGNFRVVVVGAGVFGCWTALRLQRAGVQTLLVDAWGVAHPRASSAGESRIIRGGYGKQSLYTGWAWQALADWKALEQELETTLFVPCGVLWLARRRDADLKESRKALAANGVPHETLSLAHLRQSYPGLRLEGIEDAELEPDCGVLLARYACRQVAKAFLNCGGSFQFGVVDTPRADDGELAEVRLSGGGAIAAPIFVFCPGSWMGRLFPAAIGRRVRATRQEVFFFGTPAGAEHYFPGRFPAWIDLTLDEVFYGIPALDGRGFKVACDTRGPDFDPTGGERQGSDTELAKVRGYLQLRLPELAEAPLVEGRVCQYEQTPDSELIIDRHPRHPNLWLVGGGSGHGFKLGPAVGRLVSQLILEPSQDPPPQVRLDRFEDSS